MAVSESRVVNGVTRATWDDDLEQYREFAADGTTVSLSRAYTAVELLVKAGRVAQATAGTNGATLRAQATAAITNLIADRAALDIAATANATINAGPAPYIKNLAAALRRTDQSLIQTMRLVSGLLDTTDSGA